MFIRTSRLFLRPAWPEDAPAIAEAIGCWDIVRNLGRAPWPYTIADAEAFVASRPAPDEASFLIFRRADGAPRLAGSIGFGRFLGPDQEREIGYWLAREHWGQGIATEAGCAVLEAAFEGLRLPRLAAGHFVDNPASGRVLQRLGFRPTGAVKPYPCRARGSHVDSVDYLLTREEWRARAVALREAA